MTYVIRGYYDNVQTRIVGNGKLGFASKESAMDYMKKNNFRLDGTVNHYEIEEMIIVGEDNNEIKNR